jgi:DNA-binding winged helix-turn-helix (wHTH) protein/alpha-beta hydrolase superfamily lysophospholipase
VAGRAILVAVRYSFANLVMDTDRFVLERDGVDVRIEPQVFDVLAHLVERRDRVVLKTELLDDVWGDRFVSESALTSRIKTARRVVGDDGAAQRVIQTVHGRGYRFVAPVEVMASPEAPERPAVSERKVEQRIHFTTAPDGVRLAYATVGTGPPLVRAAHWITHLDYDWHSPVWRHWIEGLARRHTFIRFDERGCGLSDHDPAEISLDAFVRDLETVVDAVGLERFPLVGVSQGGAVAVRYAARHPERVSKLVLVGAYVRGRRARARDEQELRAAELHLELVRHGWGSDDPSFRMAFPPSFIPDAPPELWSDFAELMRRTASAENAVRVLEALQDIDVSEEATRLGMPTIIFHARGELRIPFEQARELASLIPGSRLVPLDSRNHLMRPDEPAWSMFLDELERFLETP